MIHKYFDKAFIVNLDRRPDRMENVSKRCEAIGLEFERFSACDGKAEKLIIPTAKEVGQPEVYWNLSAAGMCQSLVRLLTKAKNDELKSILIMEDDVEFHPQVNQALEMWFDQVPTDWETLYIGTNHNQPFTPISTNVAKMNRTYALHCHAVKNSVFDLLIEKLSLMNNPADSVYADHIQPRGRSYCFRPPLAYQAADFSDIMGQQVNYTFLKR